MSYFRIVDSTFWLLFTNNYFIISPHLETIGYTIYDCNYLFHIGKGLLRSSVERTHKCRNYLFFISLILRRRLGVFIGKWTRSFKVLSLSSLSGQLVYERQKHGSNNPTTSTCLSNLMPPGVVCLKKRWPF